MKHLGDDAELYALGALGDEERARADEHIATCDACLRRVGDAEAVTAAMISAGLHEDSFAAPRPARVSRVLPWLAVAAAVCLLALPTAYFARDNARMSAAMHANETLASRIASGTLASAGFAPAKGAAMHARVLYDRAGDWYCVIVDGAKVPMQVAYVRPDGSMETIGSVAMRATGPSMTIMPIPHKMEKLALLDGNVVVASATLTF